MSTNVKVTDRRTIAAPTFDQLPMGQWFIDDMDNLYCKTTRDQAFNPHSGLVIFGDEEKVTLVEEIRIEIVK